MSISMTADDFKSMPFSRSTWAEIDLDALRYNVQALCALGGPDSSLIAVIKANAYGHGAVPVARVLMEASGDTERDENTGAQHNIRRNNICMLAVASVDEGLQLREAGINAPVLLLSAILPEEARLVVQASLVPTVFTPELARALNQAGEAEGCTVQAHLKIDTGMGRLGIWYQEAAALHKSLRALPYLRISGVYTHFSCADEPDDEMTERQMQVFEQTLSELGDLSDVMVHAANSAALLRYPATRLQVMRPGLTLYGVSPLSDKLETPVALRPVMSLKSRVTHIKEVPPGRAVSYGATWRAASNACIATVPIGYADGYPRCLSNRGHVIIHDTCCPVVGRVTMDQILVDCTHLKANLRVGDYVTLLGPQLPVQDVAVQAETIPYEILCGVAHRVPRVYLENGKKSNL